MVPYPTGSGLNAFFIDDRVNINVEYNLAKQLARHLLESHVENKALLALAHQLLNINHEKTQDDNPEVIE